MKTRLLFSLLLLIVSISRIDAQEKTSEIVGTWRLTEIQYGDRDRQILPDNVQRIKLITPTYFTWVQFDTSDNKVINSAGGKISFDGKNYIETVAFGGTDMLAFLGKEQKFEIKLEQDKMYLSGQLSSNLKIDEVWEKVK